MYMYLGTNAVGLVNPHHITCLSFSQWSVTQFKSLSMTLLLQERQEVSILLIYKGFKYLSAFLYSK